MLPFNGFVILVRPAHRDRTAARRKLKRGGYTLLPERHGRQILVLEAFCGAATPVGATDQFQRKLPHNTPRTNSSTTMTEIRFTYNQSEYIHAVRLFILRRWLSLRPLMLWIPLFAVFAWLLGDDTHGYFFNFVTISVVITIVISLVAFFIQPYFAVKRNPNFRCEYTMQFSDTGLHVQTMDIDSRLGWGLFTRLLENRSSYLLCGKSTFIVIPKSAFPTEESRMQVESLLKQKIEPH